ncbi:hypothetical protein AAVH_27650 [Aphelenchoides avenae]|nr:hypothetical protein AAVH_27650 [Aphelenchus avenae]
MVKGCLVGWYSRDDPMGQELNVIASDLSDKYSQLTDPNLGSNLGKAADQIGHDLTGIAKSVKGKVEETKIGHEVSGAASKLGGKLSEVASGVASSNVVQNLGSGVKQLGHDLGAVAGDVKEKVDGVVDDIQGAVQRFRHCVLLEHRSSSDSPSRNDADDAKNLQQLKEQRIKTLSQLELVKLPDTLSQYEEVKNQIVEELKSDLEKPSMSHSERIQEIVNDAVPEDDRQAFYNAMADLASPKV